MSGFGYGAAGGVGGGSPSTGQLRVFLARREYCQVCGGGGGFVAQPPPPLELSLLSYMTIFTTEPLGLLLN